LKVGYTLYVCIRHKIAGYKCGAVILRDFDP